ncbi:hypothetical protein QYE76_039967 [Lolium multiflorum]|uniref:MULE transposase domain-containing protein n=1 Tax=Lolium multiflorum TaxID=4521 RepID=A0AAD8TAQ6_LOLMU|nr:hypothetical protein QYE76_039967 [Lolium multiflorum]
MEDQYMEDIAFARFDDTDDEERNENNDNLVLADYEGDDLPTIEWNRDDPQLAAGTIKKNEEVHRCPPQGGEPEVKIKLAKTRWLADRILDWLRETPSLSPTALQKKMVEKFDIKVPYMRMFYAKEMALDKVNGPWNESFQLLYTFKVEVEMASPCSVVAIDKHTVPYKLKSGKVMHKECFRKAFVCFKACWKGFLDGCRPYLAVDATTLHGRFKGQLVAATPIDGHSWMFPVAYGVLEVESEESLTWFLQNLRDLIGHPIGLVIHTYACKGLESAVEAVFPGVEHRESHGMEDRAGAANSEENEAVIQHEEIEAAIQHEEIEAAIQHEEIEAAIQHEEIEAAIQREEIEPMDRELLEPMSLEEREKYERDCLEFTSAQLGANFKEQIAEEKAQASQKKKKKNKKEGKRKVDIGNIPGRVTRNLLMMKNTKTAVMPTVVIDGKIIEAIAYNITPIQPSMSEPVDVSLPLPSSDRLLMKDTKTADVPTVVIDATNIEAITYNIASMAQIQPSMLEPVDVSLPVPRVQIDAKTIEAIVYNRTAKPPIQPSADPSLMKYTKTAAVPDSWHRCHEH